MAKTRSVSFRIPSKYIVFLDTLASEAEGNRTAILVQMLDKYLAFYLSQNSAK